MTRGDALYSLLTHPLALSFFERIGTGVPVLMLHRFRDDDTGVEGHDPHLLRAHLDWLRRRRYRLVSLSQLLDELGNGRTEPRTVCFTVDDGYADFSRVGAHIFAEFDCPVTLFVTTGFIDGRLWFWWDQIDWMFRHADRVPGTLTVAGMAVPPVGNGAERRAAVDDVVARLKEVRDDERLEAMRALASDLDIEVPAVPPPECRPMAWRDVQALARGLVEVGPHSDTHPILSRVGDERARSEIRESWARLRAQLPAAVPLFCYPNGRARDFSVREERLLREAGLRAAVATTEGFLTPDLVRRRPHALPRFGYPGDRRRFRAIVGGVEAAKHRLRIGAP